MLKAINVRRIRGFDGLRALSALMVFYEHKVSPNGIGALGVWTFFCLSGYLIIGILHRARVAVERDGTPEARHQALLDFWRNRAVRIFPIYYATLFVVAAAGRMKFPELAYYLTYLQNFYIGFGSHNWGTITHFWSLAIEQQFYVLAAPPLIWMTASKHRASMLGVLGCCVAFIVIAGVAGWDEMQVSLVPFSNFAFMAVGGYIALEGERSRLGAIVGHPMVLAVSTFGIAAEYVALWVKNPHVDVMPSHAYLAGLLFAGSLLYFVLERQTGLLVSFLELPPLRWLGTISYGFYVYHYLVPNQEPLLQRLHWGVLTRLTHVEWIVVQLACSLLIAHVSWVYFERRFLALKSHKSVSGVGRVT